ncbi:hypothetical protein POM88_024695 [Heracleum sosnowskyi]|uniref:F-box associated beta-propeller type 3 domain-containing protein n=1 Tax=Heracleum sosnowskyi TaxID=360622 RepID=A0AAD8I3H6_9APIA|nr:hypothetical protein POM88_024695 [Heracleum sosnowskyi]
MCPNKDLSWRKLNIPEYDEAKRLQKYDCRRCVLEEGILFIPALLKVVSSNPIILCVDLVQQVCTTLNAPESLGFEDRGNINFQLWRGKPALSFVSEEKLNVWILEDYKKQKWAETMLIPLPFLEEEPNLKKMIPNIYQGDEEDLLVYPHSRRGYPIGYHIYKVNSKVLGYDSTPPPTRVVATFVSVKGMRPKE